MSARRVVLLGLPLAALVAYYGSQVASLVWGDLRALIGQ